MKKLNYELKNLARINKDGSHGTRAARHKNLQLIANQLDRLGFKNMSATSLKAKHVWALVRHWQSEISSQTGKVISNGTIKNRMSFIRWWAGKVSKESVIPNTNKELGIADRRRLPSSDKAFTLSSEQRKDLPTYLKLSLRLQQEFGLRREESAKFNLKIAEQENQIRLEASWTKGGRERVIPITTSEQRKLIEDIRSYAPKTSLIPVEYDYNHYKNHRYNELRKINMPASHGLRHHYAQQRYLKLTKGLLPPRMGGPLKSFLTEKEFRLDQEARSIVSAELGHVRIDIVRTYLG